MIFMTMGNDNSADLVFPLYQVGDIGDNIIDPQHIIFGEHDARVYDENFSIVFIDHHVPSHFP